MTSRGWCVAAKGMINGWRTTMHGDIHRYNGGPRPVRVDALLPIGKRVEIEISGLSSEEADAFLEGLEAGLITEIWLSKDGKFA